MQPVNRKVTYRLYPTKSQAQRLLEMLGAHQRLYNAALEQRRLAYRMRGVSIGFAKQCKELTILRAESPEYRVLDAQSAQVTLKRVDLAFRHFFRRMRKGDDKPGFPRFKAWSRFRGWGYKTHGVGWRLEPGPRMRHGRIRLSGIGMIRMRGGARTPGTPKTCEIVHKAGRWYASITVACCPERHAGTLVGGLDWGVETFATVALSDGDVQKIENPRHSRQALGELRYAQRELAKKQRGSKNHTRACKIVTRVQERIANRRKDFLHKITTALVAVLAVIATETLSIQRMTAYGGRRKRGLNREILSTAPASFLQMLRTKAAEAGCEWVEIPTRQVKPSQTCSRCGRQEKKPLSLRIHECPCGLHCSRDENAARVMLHMALTGSATGWEPTGCGAEARGSAVKHEALPYRAHGKAVQFNS